MTRSRLFPLLALLPAMLVGGCSGPDLLNALVPSNGYTLEAGIPYGPGPRQRLDIYRPLEAEPELPVLVFVYGGGWETGEKGDFAFVAEAFTSRGYVTVIPDYRLYPDVRFPAFVEDAAAAVAQVQAGVAAGRPVVLVGHSAGAYTAVMLALNQAYLCAAGGDPGRVAAAVGIAGPYDFLPLTSDTLKAIFGPGPAGPDTQPISFADGTDPPLLLLHGTADTTVRPGNAERLAAKIAAAGGTVETRLYDGLGHIRIVAALGRPLRFLAPTLEDADGFLRAQGRDRAHEQACPQPPGR